MNNFDSSRGHNEYVYEDIIFDENDQNMIKKIFKDNQNDKKINIVNNHQNDKNKLLIYDSKKNKNGHNSVFKFPKKSQFIDKNLSKIKANMNNK